MGALGNYVFTAGSPSTASYCSGSYDIAHFPFSDAGSCAEECDARVNCVQFVILGETCRLSSTCTSYTHANSGVDGYLKKAASALGNYVFTAGSPSTASYCSGSYD